MKQLKWIDDDHKNQILYLGLAAARSMLQQKTARRSRALILLLINITLHSAPEENSEEKKGAGILSMVFGTI